MRQLLRKIEKVGQSNDPVLIESEIGTDPKSLARLIHEAGPFADKPFLSIDCRSWVPALLETKLFADENGSLVGLPSSLAAAGRGTVFISEVGEMSWSAQSQLIGVLEKKTSRGRTAKRHSRIEARIIASTSRDLEAAIQERQFRKDLYRCLNALTLRIPPLRERIGDIPAMVSGMIEEYEHAGNPVRSISKGALNLLMAYSWPGNVLELEDWIRRALILASGPVLQVGDVSGILQGAHRPTANTAAIATQSNPSSVNVMAADRTPLESHTIPWAETEKQAILTALRESDGDKILAARRLGIGTTTMYRKLKQYLGEPRSFS